MKKQYLNIHSLNFGLAGGVIGAVVAFLITILGIYGFSQMASFMTQTAWGSYGYSVSWVGSFIGLVIGFVYGFVMVWVGAMIYNKLNSS